MDRVISQSENISLPQEITLSVTLDQLTNAIGFEVSQHADLQLVTSMLLCVVSMHIYYRVPIYMHESSIYRLPIGGLATSVYITGCLKITQDISTHMKNAYI